jgi:tetratricopeptide (TPR) repeat protein
MESQTQNSEYLATYGCWDLDAFLLCLASSSASLALIIVETSVRSEDAREVTNRIIHQVWDLITAQFPHCVGHRLDWCSLFFLFSSPDTERASILLDSLQIDAQSHQIHHGLVDVGQGLLDRQNGIRQLEDLLEQVRTNRIEAQRMTLSKAKQLRSEGQHEEARAVLIALTQAEPHNAQAQYEAACVHDYLGYERAAIPFYVAALAGELGDHERRSAYLGLGSTYRALGQYEQAHTTLQAGVNRFPDALDLKVFLAMALHNIGRSKEAVELLLMLLVETTNDADIQAYSRAIILYAQDISRTWNE